MNRREMLTRSGAAALTVGLSHFPLGWTARADTPKRRILMYTKSQGFQHSVVKRGQNNELSLAEQIVTDLGAKHVPRMRVIDPSFPGAEYLKVSDLLEEWYALKNFAPDLHVILVQDNEGMKGVMYQRPSFPATWARRHHKGRVFYTSMGHRE